MPNESLELSIQFVKGVGPHRAKLLKRLGIQTVRDALWYLPYRYEDRRVLKKISSLSYGHGDTVMGKIVSAQLMKTGGKHFRIFEVVINDGSGLLRGVWFNQPYLKNVLTVGSTVLFSGTIRRNPRWGIGYEMDHPEFEIVNDGDDSFIHMNRIVPVYRVTSGLTVRQMRTLMFHIVSTYVSDLLDIVPPEILSRNKLVDAPTALRQIHFPDADSALDILNRGTSAFHKRLSFDELLLLELGLAILKKRTSSEKGIAFRPPGATVHDLISSLPFRLTTAQQRVFQEILRDMESAHPMNRLIQGDVGSGKTILALMAMVTAAENGYQSALMAPTEVLAEQHYLTMYRTVGELGLNICLLSGGIRERPMEQIASGEIQIVVGTHALIQENVRFKNLGLIVIDEQHRFGVMQRATLKRKGQRPDVLVMTATPIPRTLALTAYGDLDISVIDELPPGRQPIRTILYHEDQKGFVYEHIKEEVKRGRQVYVVYPVIEESEKTDLKSAITGKAAFERMFPSLKVGLMHGRMKTPEREQIMAAFKMGEIDILVCTTVIEVGVDVPNASLMIIIHAERFGLSQLHQLRGRIGRGPYRSTCILLAYPPYGDEARRRLAIMLESTDGFRIAEEDLNIRGPGEFFGTRQSGMPDLAIANIARDADMLSIARREAFSLIEHDPHLDHLPHLKQSVDAFWRGKIEIFKTG